MSLKMRLFSVIPALFVLLLASCNAAQQRGMHDSSYVSTSNPAISVTVRNMPLLTGGEGTALLHGAGMTGGLPIRMWLAAYGNAAQGPLAVVAHAEVPDGWYWDGIMRRPFSVDEAVEVIDGQGFQACTFVEENARNPFAALAGQESAPAARWLVRAFASRFNFSSDKIILEYREPLPENIVSLSALPFGSGDLLKAFEQRAREAFRIAPPPDRSAHIAREYAQNILWRHIDERFLGTVSQYDRLPRR